MQQRHGQAGGGRERGQARDQARDRAQQAEAAFSRLIYAGPNAPLYCNPGLARNVLDRMDYSFLFGLASSGAGLIFGRARKGGAREAWQKAAETYGLVHKPAAFWSGPKLYGRLSGNELTVDMKNRNTASAMTRFRLGIPSLNLGLRLRKKRMWNSIGPRTLVGDKAFDNQVVTTGNHATAVREFLTPERRTAIQSFVSSFKGAVVTDDQISLTAKGEVKKADEMLGAIDAMLHVASVLAEETRSAVSQHEAVPPAAPVPADAVDAAEPRAQRERSATAEPALEPESLEAPAGGPEPEPELEPEPTPMPEAEAMPSVESLRPEAGAPGVEEFCAAVFAPGALSFAANQKFKECYAGERIAWTGTLESVTPFTFDFDFGPGRGVKAVLTILESATADSRKVQAIVGLPPGTEGLGDRIGQPVAFAGRLVKVDGLAKRVVIADGELRAGDGMQLQ